MKHWFTGLLLSIIITTGAAVPALAQNEMQPQWYEVEVLFFENLSPDALTAEQWPLSPGRPAQEKVLELLHPDQLLEADTKADLLAITAADASATTLPDGANAKPTLPPQPRPEQPYVVLPVEQYKLQQQYAKLEKSGNYQPLLHIAWRQVIPERSKPDRIHLHSDIKKISSILMNKGADIITAPAFSKNLEAPSFVDGLALAPDVPALDGIISLGLGRYIHVDIDFIFKKPGLAEVVMPETTNFFDANDNENFVLDKTEEEVPDAFRIRGNLRLPSGEIHYLDHPLVGMLIMFTRYTPPVIETPKSPLPPL